MITRREAAAVCPRRLIANIRRLILTVNITVPPSNGGFGSQPIRIPPCGRGLNNSPWYELDIVQGVPTCLACHSIAPGNLTVSSSW